MDDLGDTPLHDVSRGKYDSEDAGVDIARLLLERGADVNMKNSIGRTPLDLASKRSKVAQLLVAHGTIAGVDTQPEPEPKPEPEPEPRAGPSRIGFFRR